MSITLAQARKLYGHLAGQGNNFTDRVNQVISRLLPEGNWKGTKEPVHFVVYLNARGEPIVTLPRELENILGGAYEPRCNSDLPDQRGCGGLPLAVRNNWYQFGSAGPGNEFGSDARRGIIALEGTYTTFADWDEPMLMRLKFEAVEAPGGQVIFRGLDDGNKIYSTINGAWAEGFALPFVSSTVTSTQTVDSPPYQIIKPVTKGRVRLYAVDADAVETLVGYYEPDETNPSYSRFKVPFCRTDNT